MKLYEYETMQSIFQPFAIPVPAHIVLKPEDPSCEEKIRGFLDKHQGAVIKAQVLVGKRGKAGGVRMADDLATALQLYREVSRMEIWGEKPQSVMICEKLDIVSELYASITYSPQFRSPALTLSLDGGMEIESLPAQAIHVFALEAGPALYPYQARQFLLDIGFDIPDLFRPLSEIISRLYRAFWVNEARMVEVNPLAVVRDKNTRRQRIVAADAVALLDDDAGIPPANRFPARGLMGRPLTERELAAAAIDENDHRGKAGSYIELDGDIAMMTFGGGGSTVIAESVLELGMQPANLTDIGGNPPAEKMRRIARVILSKPGLRGVLVCGGTSSNTRVDITLGEGLVQAIDELCRENVLSRDLIWLVRRGGPEYERGLRLLYECWARNGIRGLIFDSSLPLTEAPALLKSILERESQETYATGGQ